MNNPCLGGDNKSSVLRQTDRFTFQPQGSSHRLNAHLEELHHGQPVINTLLPHNMVPSAIFATPLETIDPE